jgi:hypothetical protein
LSHDFILMEVLRDDWFAKAEERLAARQAYADRDAARNAGEGKPT